MRTTKRIAYKNIKKHTSRRYKAFERRYKQLTKIKNIFKPGDYVLVKTMHLKGNQKKLTARYTGPYKIIALNTFKNSSLLIPLNTERSTKKLQTTTNMEK